MIFNSEAALGVARERNRRLCNLLDDFNDKRLNLRLSATWTVSVMGWRVRLSGSAV
jgi:3'-phosphoadenosine 5'-phosphosulfate sulfotransferase